MAKGKVTVDVVDGIVTEVIVPDTEVVPEPEVETPSKVTVKALIPVHAHRVEDNIYETIKAMPGEEFDLYSVTEDELAKLIADGIIEKV